MKIILAILATTVVAFAAEMPATLPPMLGEPVLVESANTYQWLEGARWDVSHDRLLFTDTFGAVLYELKADGTINPVRTATDKANNLEFDPQGRLVTCRITGHVSRFDLAADTTVDAITDYAGHTLQFPNDLVVTRDGTIFFSDSKVLRIFRIDPAGRLFPALPDGPGEPGCNGLALSPDQKTLYVTFTKDAEVRAFDLASPDHLAGPRLLASTEPKPDGLCVDRDGNLYVGTASGVQVISAHGKSLGVLPVPGLGGKERVTKCVFGGADGRTLFVLLPGKFFRVPAKIPGW